MSNSNKNPGVPVPVLESIGDGAQSANPGFKDVRGQGWAATRRWFSQANESQVLFPAAALVLLAAIWGMTWNVIRVELIAAETAAAVSGRELAETYEAQVVRALREIGQTLKLVKYAYELKGQKAVVQGMALTLSPTRDHGALSFVGLGRGIFNHG